MCKNSEERSPRQDLRCTTWSSTCIPFVRKISLVNDTLDKRTTINNSWIDQSPTPTTIQKARTIIESYSKRNSTTTPGHISIQIEGSAPRAPSPRKKSPKKGWSSAAASLMASAKWRKKIDKRPSMMQGQGMVEMSNLESKTSSPHHETKSESHADFKLPEDVRNFQPLGERADVKSSCESLRETQKTYVELYKSKSKEKEKKLSQLEDRLRKNVNELKKVLSLSFSLSLSLSLSLFTTRKTTTTTRSCFMESRIKSTKKIAIQNLTKL